MRNLKIHLLASPSIPAAYCKAKESSPQSTQPFWGNAGHSHCQSIVQSCQVMSPAMAARAAQHGQNTGLCLWVSPAWLHSSPWSVVLDSGEKDEMWVSCRDPLHRLEAPVPLCFFYCHLISFPPSSEMQRRSLLHTREADKMLKGLQTLFIWS